MTQQRRTPGRAPGSGRPGSRQPSGTGRPGMTGGPRVPRGTGNPSRLVAEQPRSASRPAGARRPGRAAGSAKITRAPQPHRFTGRIMVLALVLGALLLAYAYPVRVYLNQQAQIADLEASQAAQRQRIRELTEENAKWSDDEYIKAQARQRLQMVLPGDIAYVIVDPSVAAQNPGADPEAGRARDTGPWYGKLWSSVQAADKPRPAS